MEQSPSWEAESYSDGQEIPCHHGTKDLLQHSQQPTIRHYHKSDESSP
jgi:hypothetical protein